MRRFFTLLLVLALTVSQAFAGNMPDNADPVMHKITLQVAPGVKVNLGSTGIYGVTHGDKLSLELSLDTVGYTFDDMLLLVNGEKTELTNPGDGFGYYSFTIPSVEAPYSIEAALKHYTVSLPESITGGGFNPQGDSIVKYGESIEFHLWLGEPYYLSDGVYANGVKLEESPMRSSMHFFRIEAVKEPITIEAKGIKGEITGTTEIVQDTRMYSENGMLYIENLPAATPVMIYSLTGKLAANQIAQTNLLSIPLAKGIYIVKTGKAVQKVIVR